MPTVQTHIDQKRFFVPSKEDPKKKFPVTFIKVTTVLTWDCGDKVTFVKSNRSKGFVDSREPKKRISRDEVLAELKRMLGDEQLALQAMGKMIV